MVSWKQQCRAATDALDNMLWNGHFIGFRSLDRKAIEAFLVPYDIRPLVQLIVTDEFWSWSSTYQHSPRDDPATERLRIGIANKFLLSEKLIIRGKSATLLCKCSRKHYPPTVLIPGVSIVPLDSPLKLNPGGRIPDKGLIGAPWDGRAEELADLVYEFWERRNSPAGRNGPPGEK